MHTDPNEKFYIPENVYIIGTMNDIDRSVDSFDFAMRRRFRFVEVRAEDTQDMLESLEDEELKTEAIARMDKLNAEIIRVADLNENYQIGASYFLKLKVLGFDDLWTDYLQPLLQDYVRGLNDEEECMRRFAKAYGYTASGEGDSDEAAIIKDNQYKSKSYFSEIKDVVDCIADKTLAELEKKGYLYFHLQSENQKI